MNIEHWQQQGELHVKAVKEFLAGQISSREFQSLLPATSDLFAEELTAYLSVYFKFFIHNIRIHKKNETTSGKPLKVIELPKNRNSKPDNDLNQTFASDSAPTEHSKTECKKDLNISDFDFGQAFLEQRQAIEIELKLIKSSICSYARYFEFEPAFEEIERRTGFCPAKEFNKFEQACFHQPKPDSNSGNYFVKLYDITNMRSSIDAINKLIPDDNFDDWSALLKIIENNLVKSQNIDAIELFFFSFKLSTLTYPLTREAIYLGLPPCVAFLQKLSHPDFPPDREVRVSSVALSEHMKNAALEDSKLRSTIAEALNLSEKELIAFSLRAHPGYMSIQQLLDILESTGDDESYALRCIPWDDYEVYEDGDDIQAALIAACAELEPEESPICPIRLKDFTEFTYLDEYEASEKITYKVARRGSSANPGPGDQEYSFQTLETCCASNHYRLATSLASYFILSNRYGLDAIDAVINWQKFDSAISPLKHTPYWSVITATYELVLEEDQASFPPETRAARYFFSNYVPPKKSPVVKLASPSQGTFALEKKCRISQHNYKKLPESGQKFYNSSREIFSLFSHRLGHNDYDWGSITTSFFKVVESILANIYTPILLQQKTISELAALNIKVDHKHISVGALLLALKKFHRLTETLQQLTVSANATLHQDKDLLDDLQNLNTERNRGSHATPYSDAQFLQFIEKLFGEKGVLPRLLDHLPPTNKTVL